MWISGSGHERLTRWHTADGLATKTIGLLDYPADVLSLAEDGSGPTVTIRGHWQRHFDHFVLGDRFRRVLTEIVAIYLSNMPGQGLVVHDTGNVTFAPGADFEEVTSMHDEYSDPGFIDRFICDALT